MTVLLVLFTFITFLLIDYFRTRNAAVHPVLETSSGRATASAGVSGRLRSPGKFAVSPRHTWAISESPNLVRVGMDDFASKLTGALESITLPQRGQWIRQGQKLCTIHRDGCAVDMVSPIEGTVSDINEAVAKNPTLALGDPYGEGWLLTVQRLQPHRLFHQLQFAFSRAAPIESRVM